MGGSRDWLSIKFRATWQSFGQSQFARSHKQQTVIEDPVIVLKGNRTLGHAQTTTESKWQSKESKILRGSFSGGS